VKPGKHNLRLIVCGGRDYADHLHVWATLDRLHAERTIVTIIEGGATGADHMAGQWADQHHVEHRTVAADWKQHGRRAGPLRNGEMLKLNPDGVVAFPGGPGTGDMIHQARAARVPVWEVPEPPVAGSPDPY
jgi:hypothetical protein